MKINVDTRWDSIRFLPKQHKHNIHNASTSSRPSYVAGAVPNVQQAVGIDLFGAPTKAQHPRRKGMLYHGPSKPTCLEGVLW